jgi:trk system potassium uptake protein TrkH
MLRALPREDRRTRWTFLLLPPLLLGALLQAREPALALSWLALHQGVALLLVQIRQQSPFSWLSVILDHPARLLVATFAFIILVGGTLLSLPVSGAPQNALSMLDAFFTAVSACCVTGLSVIDTARDLSGLGQVILLLLIQVGGLGIMTFSTVGVVMLGRRLGVRHEIAVGDLLGPHAGGDLYGIARRVLRITFAAEGAGAVVLTALFWYGGDALPIAAWRAVFTSVAAFCNAGFALQSDSLMGYQQQPLVLHTVALLIIVGGLGTPVIHALPDLFRRKPASLHTSLVVGTTLLLLVVPALLIAVLEWSNTLGGLSIFDKLNNAWFQSVTPRTAGFYSIDYTILRPATVTLTLVLMFIGGSPFSTAGGVKTTTIALLILAVVAALQGRPEATAFKRRISHESIYKAAAIMTVVTTMALLGFGALQITQDMPFDMALFEVTSALGTVGLSTGGTARLDGVGKLIIMTCMFAGRVGPLTLFLLLVERRRQPSWVRPEERVAVG